MGWEKTSSKRVPSEQYRLGKWIVGRWELDTTASCGSGETYAAYCDLPGIKASLGLKATADDAKALVEKAVQHWLEGLAKDTSGVWVLHKLTG
jgi:hypothetical protein